MGGCQIASRAKRDFLIFNSRPSQRCGESPTHATIVRRKDRIDSIRMTRRRFSSICYAIHHFVCQLAVAVIVVVRVNTITCSLRGLRKGLVVSGRTLKGARQIIEAATKSCRPSLAGGDMS
jgi:hypothetical protein